MSFKLRVTSYELRVNCRLALQFLTHNPGLKTHHSKLITLTLAICAIALFSCNSTGERYSDLKSLRLGFIDSIPHTFILQKQTHASSGLEVDLIRFNSPMERDSALLQDSIDGVIMNITDAIIMHDKGLPIRIVMENDTTYHLIAGIGNGIRSVDELTGKNIAVDRNTINEYLTDRILQEAGIAPVDVNKAGIKKISLRLDLLQNGLLDAAILPEPYSTIAIDRGNRSIYEITGKNISIAATVFTNASINKKEKEIEVYLRGYKKPELPAPGEIQYAINWLKEKKLITTSYTGEHLVDTLKGIILKH